MIIGFSGFARCGKNTAADEFAKLVDCECKYFAFADTLKNDLQPLVDKLSDYHGKDFKEQFRSMYVAWSKTAKHITGNETYWIDRIKDDILSANRPDNLVLITDVRYHYEYDFILNNGGVVFYISRPNCFPANDEEARSFTDIQHLYPDVIENPIRNNDSKVRLGQKVLYRYYQVR